MKVDEVLRDICQELANLALVVQSLKGADDEDREAARDVGAAINEISRKIRDEGLEIDGGSF